MGLYRYASALDARLLAVSRRGQYTVIALTAAAMVYQSIPFVPKPVVDYSHLPLLNRIPQNETYGTDTIADMYEAKVVLNDPADMYTKDKVDQTPLEAGTWSKEASSPYLPAVLLSEAALYALGGWTGLGFYGLVLLLACLFLALSAWYFVQTRWYLFPVLYLNFSYFGYRFVYVQDGSYLIMLVTVMAALLLADRHQRASQALVAVATVMKLSPLYYAKNVLRMDRTTAVLFVAILAAGLVLPYFVWDNYLYIYRFNEGIKGSWGTLAGAVVLAIPFAALLWYVEGRAGFDLQDRIGWGLVPVAMFLALKMNVPRHLLIVLLVPDKRGFRNIVAAAGLGFYALFPGLIRFGSVLSISVGLLFLVLIHYLGTIGWHRVREDFRHPLRTIRMMITAGVQHA